MDLPAPNLDHRTFRDLVDEARARIPRYTPEWTNLNDSDPGMTLVKLHAWMTETILHELNRVPELNYVKFLDLLGIRPRPAQPARAELAFTLDKLGEVGDPLSVPVPAGTKVAVDDPDLPAEVVFETDRTLIALNAHVGAVLAADPDAAGSHALVTGYDEGVLTWLHSFHPFGPGRAGDDAAPAPPLYIGVLLRPWAKPPLAKHAEDRLPAGPLDLHADAVQVYDEGPDGQPEQGPPELRCPDGSAADPAGRRLVWQVYTGGPDGAERFTEPDGDWRTLSVAHDGTLGLLRSGHVVLELPAGATPVDPRLLGRELWEGFGATRPPRSREELIDALEALDILPGLAGLWERMGVHDPEDRLALAACGESVQDTVVKLRTLPEGTLRPELLSYTDWTAVSDEFTAGLPRTAEQLRPLYWLRATAAPAPGDGPPGELRGLHLNTTPATQAATRLEDVLGTSTGRPAQSFVLPRTPVLVDPATGRPDVVLRVSRPPGAVPPADADPWAARADLLDSGPDDPHYLLDPATGRITFGDGLRGRIPERDARITAVRFRTGGGSAGNVPAGTITKVKGRLPHVKAVTNPRASHDGTDAEDMADVKRRAPLELRTRDRAVTAQDFADLALRTPGVSLHQAYAVARRVPTTDGQELAEKDGAVTLVVLPRNDQPAPQPSEEQLRAVCRWLEPRRLVTTELHVVGPCYTQVETLAARVAVRDGHDLTAVAESVRAALLEFLHPLRGGTGGTGWPFGEDVYHADLYDVVLGVDGVRRVRDLRFALAGTPDTGEDVTPLADGHLPVLTRAAMNVEARYE